MDWSVGQILDALQPRRTRREHTGDLHLRQRTVAVLWQPRRHRRDRSAKARGHLSRAVCACRSWRGGRVGFLQGAVGHLPAMNIDILPTFAKLAGTAAPAENVIDGRDMWPLLSNERGASAPHDALYFYWGARAACGPQRPVEATRAAPVSVVRAGRPGRQSRQVRAQGARDCRCSTSTRIRAESTNVAAQHPDVVKKLQAYVERAREDLGDSLTKRVGRNVRPAGKS